MAVTKEGRANVSTNLYLVDPKSGKACGMFYTSTIAAEKIYGSGDKKYEILLRYFEHVDTEMRHLGPGTVLDHKLEVAMFLVQYPLAKWEAG